MREPTVSVVIPTRARPDYLEVALSSIAPQAAAAGAEVLVVDDGPSGHAARALAERFSANYVAHPAPSGLNVARNTGANHSSGELVVFVDDDVRALPGWLQALARSAGEHPDVDVFTGPIRPRLEGRAPRSCGREGPPITTLDLGERDTGTRYAWGANMAIRRSALERVGQFDTSIEHGGDEQEWQDRLAASNGAGHPGALYVAAAAVEHRRAGADARLRALASVAHARGRAAQRFDARRGQAPALQSELATLARCVWHVVRRRCPAGLTMVAHSAGRAREALRKRQRDDGLSKREDDFLSGESGTVGGLGRVRRELCDRALDGIEIASGRRAALRAAARRNGSRQRILAITVERAQNRTFVRNAQAELKRSGQDVELRAREPEARGKFENLNLMLADGGWRDADWLLLLDDDIELPRGFLDRFIFLCERFSFALAQPAHRLASHAAWRHTRRRALSVAREVAFVEIGPLTALSRAAADVLVPFPELRMGWGLDAHWAVLAREHGWRCGVIDATPIRHLAAPVAAAYSHAQAVEEAREFLADRAYLPASQARQTLARHRRW
jgi:GT2 family glycosyltransferase